MKIENLSQLPLNQNGRIENVECNEGIKRRLLDLGIIENSNITPVFRSPFKDPTAYLIRGTIVALRSDDTRKIIVTTSI